MRTILILCGLLMIAGWAGTIVHIDPPPRPPLSPNRWVKTVDGWERPLSWQTKQEFKPPLSPWVVASLEMFASLFALVLLPPRSRRFGGRRRTLQLASAAASRQHTQPQPATAAT